MIRDDKKQPAIIIRVDAETQIAMLTDNEAGKVFKAILRYANTGETMKTRSRVMAMAFAQIRATIDSYHETYEAKRARNKAIAEERWKRKKEADEAKITAATDDMQDDTNVYERTQTYTNVCERLPNKSKVNQSKVNQSKVNTLTIVSDENARAREGGDDYYSFALDDSSYLERCAMALHIALDRARALLTDFETECKAKGAAHVDERDYRSHFFDWARIQVEKDGRGSRRKGGDKNQDIDDIWKSRR